MTTSMRERIARVIDETLSPSQASFQKADAVLDVLLTPTEEMCVAGLETNTRFGPRAMEAIFRAMVCAAKEGK